MENLELARVLRDFMRHGIRMSRRWSEELELSTTQLGILNSLTPEGVRASTIARELGITKPSVTEALKRLDLAGYVTKGTDPLDSRAVIVLITERGKSARMAGNLARDGRIAAILESLDPEDIAALSNAAGAIDRLSAKFQSDISPS